MTRTTKLSVAAFLAVVTATVGLTVATASDHGRRHGEREEEGREGREEHDHDHEHGRAGREGREGRGDGGERGRAVAASAGDPGAAALYRKECGACHVAFPPRMLSADAHRRTLAGLDRHFGQNAELDAPARDRLERWMVENAGGAGGNPSLRVTEQPRFQHEHRKLGPDVVARPAVRSLANCAACHPGATGWDFDEDRVKIPR